MRFDDDYKFYVPIKFYNGYGRFADLGKLSDGIGKKFLLVTGKSAMKKMGFTDMILSILKAFDPQKAKPLSNLPFLALTKANAMQYGAFW